MLQMVMELMFLKSWYFTDQANSIHGKKTSYALGSVLDSVKVIIIALSDLLFC